MADAFQPSGASFVFITNYPVSLFIIIHISLPDAVKRNNMIIHEIQIKKRYSSKFPPYLLKTIQTSLLNPGSVSTHLISVRSGRIGKQPSLITIGHGVKVISLSVYHLPAYPHSTHCTVIHRI